ncbi:MAG TPA: transposase [Burkholderiales bacterium]
MILPGVAVHITQRGNDRADCFRRDSDYLVYLVQLRELAATLECAVHAYCLMTNHVHLLTTPATAGACSNLMKNLGQRYAQYFNRAHERTGALWEGRFHSCIVESPRYVLACYRYIELNPVRAGLVRHPRAYAWSSYAANAGLRSDKMLTPHPEFVALSEDPARRRSMYRGLVEQALEAKLIGEIRSATVGGYPLGSDRFKASLASEAGRKLERQRRGRRKKLGSDPNFPGIGV